MSFIRLGVGFSPLFWKTLRGLRLIEVVMSFPALLEPRLHEPILVVLFQQIVASGGAFDDGSRKILTQWWSRLDKPRFEARLALFHQAITMRLLMAGEGKEPEEDMLIVGAARTMAILYKANSDNAIVKYSEFYNEFLNTEVDLVQDFIRWLQQRSFSFCLTPFLLNPGNKADLLKFESQVKQREQRAQAVRAALQMAIMGNGLMDIQPYLIFKVRRDHLIADTLENLVRNEPEDLKKELKIKFDGEEGIDAGGVQKEFFQLIVKEIFNPDFGMFQLEPERRTYWFRSMSQEFREFELIGTILGLAIYNGVILDVHFPHVVYKMLMGRKSTLADLEDVSPELYRGMKTLLDFDGPVQEVYARDFTVEVDYFGATQVVELKPGGKDIPLTNDNREEYVKLFVDYQLNTSVAKQFAAFKKGFNLVVNGPVFGFFVPDELELLICGDPVLDFEELEKAAEYENPDEFGPSHQVVKWFWELVHELSDEEKKKLLHFATGSDRAPIGGLKNLHLVIQRHGDGDERLPSSHTCFNHLLLPAYSSKEKLKEKLMVALDNAVGFGLM